MAEDSVKSRKMFDQSNVKTKSKCYKNWYMLFSCVLLVFFAFCVFIFGFQKLLGIPLFFINFKRSSNFISQSIRTTLLIIKKSFSTKSQILKRNSLFCATYVHNWYAFQEVRLFKKKKKKKHKDPRLLHCTGVY